MKLIVQSYYASVYAIRLSMVYAKRKGKKIVYMAVCECVRLYVVRGLALSAHAL